jgi:hypothetical protein
MNKPFFRIFHIFLFSLVLVSSLQAQEKEQLRLSGEYNDVSLISFLTEIESKYPVSFYFKEEWLSGYTISLSLNDIPVQEALQLALASVPYTFMTIDGNQFILAPKETLAELTGRIINFSFPENTNASDATKTIGNPGETASLKMIVITGTIRDGKNREPVIGATIQIENTNQGGVSDIHGKYKITIKPGLYTLNISSVGYERTVLPVRIYNEGSLDIELFDKLIPLGEVMVYGNRVDRNVSGNQLSTVELDPKLIDMLPMISGSRDIIKGLTMMPGVKSVGEFSSGINVRGGGEDQNLYLLNGAPLFNTSHVFGLFSVIDPDMVDKLTLYKGHIPAIYGERVSSLVDIHTKETAPESKIVKGGIGLYDSKLIVELPFAKQKIFFNAGGRTSYSNWILGSINDVDLKNSNASFYDLNGTLNIYLDKNRIWFSAYTSYDDFSFSRDVRYAYRNSLGSAGWDFVINSNLAAYLALSYSDYTVQNDNIQNEINKNRIESGINYKGLRYRLQYGGIAKNLADVGINIIGYNIQPGKRAPLGTKSLVPYSSLEGEQGYEGALFINDEFTLNDFVTLNAGLRYSKYAYLGPKTVFTYEQGMPRDTLLITGKVVYTNNEIIKSYSGFEPRVSAKLQFNSFSSVKISYDRNIQYLSLISNTSVSTPGDIWKLSDQFLKPLIANQFTVGFYRNFVNNMVETSIEVYYKSLRNVIEYKEGVVLEMANHIESMLSNAQGTNYGIELLIKKNSGTVEGWLSYTYSRALRQTTGRFTDESINGGRIFPSSYDKPHDLSISANYHINKRFTLSANFSYSTGRPITLPEYKFRVGNDYVIYFSDKNKYRMPDYHRLDISLRYDESLRIGKKWKGRWSFSILNVYGRENAFTVFYKEETPAFYNNYTRFALYKLFLIGRPVPTITYNFIF